MVLFQVTSPVPMESLNLPTVGVGGGRGICPTNAYLMEAASLQEDSSDVVEEVEHVSMAPKSSTSDEVCSNVSQMCSDLPSIDSMFIQSQFQDASVYAILFQEAGQVPKDSLNLTTSGEGGGGDMCPTEADKMESSSYGDQDNHLGVVEVVERVSRAPGSPTMDTLCSNVSKMCFDSSP